MVTSNLAILSAITCHKWEWPGSLFHWLSLVLTQRATMATGEDPPGKSVPWSGQKMKLKYLILVESHAPGRVPWVDTGYVWLGMDLVMPAPPNRTAGCGAYHVGKFYTLCRVKLIRSTTRSTWRMSNKACRVMSEPQVGCGMVTSCVFSAPLWSFLGVFLMCARLVAILY